MIIVKSPPTGTFRQTDRRVERDAPAHRNLDFLRYINTLIYLLTYLFTYQTDVSRLLLCTRYDTIRNIFMVR